MEKELCVVVEKKSDLVYVLELMDGHQLWNMAHQRSETRQLHH
jgi:hypothetical protein